MAPAVAGSGGASGPRRLDSIPDWVSATTPLQDRHLKERDFSLGFDGGGFNRASGGEKIGSSSGGSGTWDRPLAYGYHASFDGSGESGIGAAMGIAGVVGMGVGAGQSHITGNLGGQRLIVSSGLGGAGVGQLRGDVISNEAYGAEVVARGEDFVGLYGHRVGASRRGEEEVGSGARSGGSFVAYVGGELRLHAVIRDEEAAAAHAGLSHSSAGPVPALPAAASRRGGDADQASAAEQGTLWPGGIGILTRGKSHLRGDQDDPKENESAAGAPMRIMDMPSMDEPNLQAGARLLETHAGESSEQQLQLQNVEAMRQRSASGASTACQDCGNQAKKDCPHLRCRTCCKSRGFDCSTHVKSTWVPAAKRRERRQAELAAIMAGQPRPRSKRARTLALAGVSNAAISHTSTSTGTPPRSSDFNSAHFQQQEARFKATLPSEVKAQAVFKCVRVTGIEDGQDEYAYQTAVKIGGHIFKGMLYDQGLDKSVVPPSVPELQLGGRNTSSSSALFDLAGIYGAPGSAFMGALR